MTERFCDKQGYLTYFDESSRGDFAQNFDHGAVECVKTAKNSCNGGSRFALLFFQVF
jgi:hypothetical protein